jgi:hypothetical protein
MLLLNLAAAQSQPAVPQSGGQSDLLSTVYAPPNNFGFQEVYDLLRQHNALEYQTLVRAFRQQIRPHIDQEQARVVLDTDWLEQVEANPLPQK